MGQYANRLKDLNDRGIKTPFMKYVQPEASNFYTGHELKMGWEVAVAGAAVAYGIGSALARKGTGEDDRSTLERRAVDVGGLPGTNADAIGHASGGSRNLGASGDLVFGLNNMRRRGR